MADTKTDAPEMSMRERVKELTDKLEQGLKEVFESDNYKNYLNTMAKFHNYSVNNTLLINQQKPDATLVAGYDSWVKNFDRHVKKGERGINIIAPAPYKTEREVPIINPETGQPILKRDGTPFTEKKEVTIPYFRVTKVFDISQTEGKELPTIGVNELLKDVDGAKDFIESLKKVSPIPIEFGETNGDSKGFYSPVDNKIVIKDGMSDAQTIKTMVHEISHAKLHNPERAVENAGKSKGTIEMEAESIAYIVCQHFGIDTSDYSFGYIAGWSEGKETDELKKSMNTIRETSSEMIFRVEGSMRQIDRDRHKDLFVDKDTEFLDVTIETPFDTPKQKEELKEKTKTSLKDKIKEKKEELKKRDKTTVPREKIKPEKEVR
ncbi:protein of unknown function [Lachnospiraceae bacterium G41]|nr:protein of unknown function [Lachnospiraceae bacterium G41]